MKIIKAPTISDCILSASQIAANYNSLTAKKCYVFCEDKITLALELEIAKLCGGGFFNINVLTFSRYISSQNKKVVALSKESSVMAVRKIILDKQNSLKCFKNLKYCPNLAVTVYELISQLASAKVTPEDLQEVLNNQNKLGGALTLKLQDVTLIYTEYRKYLQDNDYIDRNDYLGLMPELVKNDENLKNAVVILAGFSSVTRQREEIFRAINSVAGEVYGVVLAGDNSEVYTNETYDKLRYIDATSTVETFSVNAIPEVKALQKNLYNPEVFKEGVDRLFTDNVTITEYPDVYSEIESIAKDIVKQVKLNGNRYKDLAVMVGDLESYRLIISKVFNEYGVPYYLDRAENLSSHPICAFILDLIDLTRKNLAIKDVIRFASNGMFSADKALTDKFIIYLNKYAITRNGLKNPFKYETENLLALDELRQKIVTIYEKMIAAKTVNQLVDAIKFVIEYQNVEGNISFYNQKLIDYGEKTYAEFNNKILEKVNSLLEEIKFVLGEGKISYIDFKTIFLSGATSTSISAIPLFNDAVYVGACKDVKMKGVDILYAAGINGNVPFTKSDSALLSDGDLASLDELKIIVEPKIKIVNKREKENVCVAFTSFNKKLKVSYPNIDNAGKGTVKAEIINYLTKIFKINIESQRKKESEINVLLSKGYKYDNNEINEYISDKYLSKNSTYREVARLNQSIEKRKSAIELASLNSAIENLDENVKEKVDGILNFTYEKPETIKNANACLKGEEISATTLEEYFSCPYSNFVKNSLRLKSVETGEMQSNEIGSMLHKLVELYVQRIDRVTNEETSNALSDSILDELYSLEDYAKYMDKPSQKYVLNNLIAEGRKACYSIYQTIANSQFKAKYVELRFGETKKVKGIELNAKSGLYKVKGSIDRVDIAGDKVRIIDYKSGKAHPEVTSFYVGKNLQLYLYMNVFTRDNYKPVGAYYFPIKNDYVNEGDEQKQIMVGNTVSDAEALAVTDVNLTAGQSSSIVKVSLKDDGKIKPYSSVLEANEMNAYIEYAVMIASKGVDEINSGYIKASPYDSAVKCAYCEYGGLCKRNAKEDCDRKVTGVNSQTVVNAVLKEKELENSSTNNGEEL